VQPCIPFPTTTSYVLWTLALDVCSTVEAMQLLLNVTTCGSATNDAAVDALGACEVTLGARLRRNKRRTVV
jgi:hypothetical protein